MPAIRFSKPWSAPGELDNLARALGSGHLHGDGPFTEEATERLRGLTGAGKVLLTSSCTHALELASILLELGPGDEVVVPSFTFSSTAAAVAVRGATPVFVDVDPVTLNIDPAQVAAAVTDRTRAVYVVHYAGVAVDVAAVQAAVGEDVVVVEDNAHGLGATVDGRVLGTLAPLAAQSFHDTKNVQCGEGGALLVNDERFAERAEIVREKGTDRVRFLRGQVDKYTWVDVGSSYLPSELQTAVLAAQLDAFDEIQARRHRVWDVYAAGLGGWAADNGVRLMQVPEGVQHPAHMYHLRMPGHDDQAGLIAELRSAGVVATFHYQPLHSAPAGRRLGRCLPAGCPVTDDAAATLVRLPLHPEMSVADAETVVDLVTSYRTVTAAGSRDVLA